MPTLTDAELADRQHYLGGTDMAALAGLNPRGWAQPIDVWLDKTGQAQPRPTSPKMALGHLMEATVCDLFAAATGYRVRRATRASRDRRQPYLGGHVDRFAYHDSPPPGLPSWAILEAKTSDQPDDWGPQGSDRVPPHYRVQLLHYLGLHRAYGGGFMAVLLPHADFRWYWIAYDYDAIDTLRNLARSFWHDNVLANVPPVPDGSDSYSDFLRHRWQSDGSEAVATAEQVLWVQQIRSLDATAKALAAERERLAQSVMDSMGTTTRLLLPDNTKVHWHGYETKTTNWHALAAKLAGKRPLDRLAEPFTKTHTVRPFKVPAAKEDTTDGS